MPLPSLTQLVTKAGGIASKAAGASGFGWGHLIMAALTGYAYLSRREPTRTVEEEKELLEVTTSPVFKPKIPAGRAVLAGHRAWIRRDEAHLDIVLLLAGRPLDAIEGIWMDDVRLAIKREVVAGGYKVTAADDRRYTGRIEFYEYFLANGSQGQSMRTAYPQAWTVNHQLNGISWVHARLIKTENYQGDYPWTDTVPQFKFLVRGIKATWPGQAVPTWTDNAAALRYYYRNQVYGRTEDDVHRDTFDAAYQHCEQTVEGDAIYDGTWSATASGSDRALAPTNTIATDDTPAGVSLNRIFYEGSDKTLELRGLSLPTSNVAHFLRNYRAQLQITIDTDTIELSPDDLITERAYQQVDAQGILGPINYTAARWQLTDAQGAIMAGKTTGTARVVLKPVTRRYSINGAIEFGNDPNRVEADMDFAWMGHVVEHGILDYYEPGRSILLTADEVVQVGGDDGIEIVEVGEFYTNPDLSDRANGVSFQLPNSSRKDWLEDSVEIEDADLIEEDGDRPLVRSLPPATFVADYATATRLANLAMRLSRLFRGGSYRVKPQGDLASMKLRPFQPILLTDPAHNIDAELFLITRTRIEDDQSVSFFVREDPVSLYAGTPSYRIVSDGEDFDPTIPAPMLSVTEITGVSAMLEGGSGGSDRIDVEWGVVVNDTYARTEIRYALYVYELPILMEDLEPDTDYQRPGSLAVQPRCPRPSRGG